MRNRSDRPRPSDDVDVERCKAMNAVSFRNTELSKRSKKASTYRRVVTGDVNGRSVVQNDEQMEAYQFKTVPGYEHTLIWVNGTTPDLSKEQRFYRYPDSVVPGPGGTSLHFVTFPPASVFADPSFDGEAAREEALIRLRGLADHFEKEDPAMHKTNTVDYAIVYDGEIWMELDNGETLHLRRGDVVVQNGTRHAWRNKSHKARHGAFFPEWHKRVTLFGLHPETRKQGV